ncbi:MAG TPA: TetR/AcrR family transcriptional regulator [Lachnospiraceae bacterium]|nr:TetR/AcrR family transcriptional regulator [Lachnospiraceae bacterium]
MITNSHKETEEMMMNAVCAVTDEYGFENFTTKVWARRAKTSEGSLYNHFSNKNDILEKTFLRTDRFFVQELKKIFMKNIGMTPTEKNAKCIFDDYLEVLRDHSVEMRYCQAFIKTKPYMERTRFEQARNWSEMNEVYDAYGLQQNVTAQEIQFFFTRSVTAYAEYLFSSDSGTPDESYEDIGKLLIIVLKYILDERKAA